MRRVLISVASGVAATILIFIVAIITIYLSNPQGGSIPLGSQLSFWAMAWPLPLCERVFGTVKSPLSDHEPTILALMTTLLCHVVTYALLINVALWLHARRRLS